MRSAVAIDGVFHLLDKGGDEDFILQCSGCSKIDLLRCAGPSTSANHTDPNPE